ncbi:MAG: efflux RND transporter permease subunit [Flammeovirgaceae bacterium]
MRSIIHFFAKNALWTNALILMVCILGIMAIMEIRLSFFPEVESNIIVVNVVTPDGSSAVENQSNIAVSVDEKLANTDGIDEFTTTVDRDKCVSIIKVENVKAIDHTLEQIRDKINQITTFPPDAIISIHKQARYQMVLRIALHGNASKKTLMEAGMKIHDDLSSSGIISSVEMYGHQSEGLRIEFDLPTLLRHHLDLDQVANIIRKENRDFTLGAITTKDGFFNIQSWNKSSDPEKIKKIIIINDGEKIIRLGDLAKVSFTFPEKISKAYLHQQPCLVFDIRKTNGDNLDAIAKLIHEYTNEFNSKRQALQLSILVDKALAVNYGIDQLVSNGVSGLILVIIILGLFLNFKLSFWVSFGIPMSFLGLMIFANLFGYTINQLSLLGMIIVIGIIVDDGIVIAENIFTHHQKGKTGLQAAVDGIMEVLPSVTSSILTTIIAFIGILYIQGELGSLLAQMAMVVIITLIASFVEATLVLPGHLVNLSHKKPPKWRQVINNGLNFVQEKVYVRSLHFLLKWRWASLAALTLGLASLGLFMVRTNQVHFKLFHNIDQSVIEINIVLNRESNREQVKKVSLLIDNRLDDLKQNLKNSKGEPIIAASAARLGWCRVEEGEHTGQILISLIDVSKRRIHDYEVMERIHDAIGNIPQAKIASVIKGFRLFGKPIGIQLVSHNEPALYACEKELMDSLYTYSALTNVTSDKVFNSHEINLELLDKAYLLGINKHEIARQVKNYVHGIWVQDIYQSKHKHEISIHVNKQNRDNYNDLLELKIRTPKGEYVSLSELAEFTTSHTPEIIRHYNGVRAIKLQADQKRQDVSIKHIKDDIYQKIIPALKEKYPEVSFVKAGESKESERFKSSTTKVLIIMIPIILATMMFSLNSVTQPFLIILIFPIGSLGILFGHWIESTDITAMSATGMVSILGIVINDAIVFSDKFNQFIKEDHSLMRSIIGAGQSRFRAIILTSLTTIAGLYPLVLEQGIQAEFIKPMAIAIVYGTLLSTIIILLFYPVILLIANDIRRVIVFSKRLLLRKIDLLLHGKSDKEVKYPSEIEVEPAYRRK